MKLTDADVYQAVAQIEESDMTRDEKYTLLDELSFKIWNKHESGMSAYAAFEAVANAIQRILTHEKK